MSWFGNNEKIRVQRTLGRVLNRTTPVISHFEVDNEHDQRLDSRNYRMTPALALPLVANDAGSNIKIGLTQDISCQGLSLATLGKLVEQQEYAIALGKQDDFVVLRCRCVRTASLGYGYHTSGLHAIEVLSTPDFAVLQELAEHLEKHAPLSELDLLAV